MFSCVKNRKPENKRSIFENPKFGQKASIKAEVADGLFTSRWRQRVKLFYNSLISPSCDISKQVWLVSPKDIVGFDKEIKSSGIDLSSIEYVLICDTISDVYDIIDFLANLRKKLPDHTKLIYYNFNWIWMPLFYLSGYLGFSRNRSIGDFYCDRDLDCFF